MRSCPVCGEYSFSYQEVLWEELTSEWELSPHEKDYINKQQGFFCNKCNNNLRSMALADAILCNCNFYGNLQEFVNNPQAKKIKVLEINEAGGLGSVLKKLPGHKIIKYPEHDMLHLDFPQNTFDLVIHSDTLEHVSDPILGLSECRRVLTMTGACIFTIPIIVGRLTKSRFGLKKSYHGNINQRNDDFIVYTEFGADMWRYAFEAGFSSVKIHSINYPAALAIEAK